MCGNWPEIRFKSALEKRLEMVKVWFRNAIFWASARIWWQVRRRLRSTVDGIDEWWIRLIGYVRVWLIGVHRNSNIISLSSAGSERNGEYIWSDIMLIEVWKRNRETGGAVGCLGWGLAATPRPPVREQQIDSLDLKYHLNSPQTTNTATAQISDASHPPSGIHARSSLERTPPPQALSTQNN